MRRRPLSRLQERQKMSPGCGLAFGAIFMAAGLAFLVWGFVIPYFKASASTAWTATPCTITKSELDRSESSYYPSIEFEYEALGATHRSTTIRLGVRVGRKRASAQAVCDAYPVDSEKTCYVNPSDATEAVLEPGSPEGMGFAFIPLLFVLVGGVIFYVVGIRGKSNGFDLRSCRTKPRLRVGEIKPRPNATRRTEREVLPEEDEEDEEEAPARPKTLRPKTTRLTLFLGALFACVIWNGIISIFIKQVFLDGDPGVCASLFAIPFVVIGAVLIVSVPYSFMQLFNPVVEVTLAPGAPSLGSTTTLSWRTEGKASRIEKLSFILVGTERARYRAGTSTSEAKHDFREEILQEVEHRRDVEGGEVEVEIPADSMHTFRGRNNKIEWKLMVKGSVPLWPDVKDEYGITILPMEARE